jgi:tetratricopeptide (TPR) repeat protein
MKTLTALVLVSIVAIAGLVYFVNVGNDFRTDTGSAAAPEAASAAAATPPPVLPTIAPVGASLLDGLGDHRMSITTAQPEAQRWFDQALMLTYGFNHDAAERSFLRALEKDPECAMCWWGAALVLGPHVNAAMDPAQNPAAWERLQAARTLAGQASAREQAYIEALSARYAQNPPEDRRSLDEAYAAAMAKLVSRYPDDLDAAALHAEALMNLQPWDFWDGEGQPKGNTSEIVSRLEAILARNDAHPGALHLYIHAVEASPEPERGAAAADRLRGLIPGSGHLVHMPAHIYARVGRWHDAALVNQDAILADDLYLATCRPVPGVYPLGYVPHNHHFLWFAATMAGERATALAAAQTTGQRTDDAELMRMPGMEALQQFSLTPLFAKVRFGLWEEVAALPRPAEDLPFQVAIWHYAQGLAALRQQRLEDAGQHYEGLLAARADPRISTLLMWDRYSLQQGVQVAERVLAGELAAARGEAEAAVVALQEAVALEDAIPYDEPPLWYQPVRQTLGAVLLEQGKAGDAEAVYREELRRNPENGWSLFGLHKALVAQDKAEAAAEVQARFEQAWAHADFVLTASRL